MLSDIYQSFLDKEYVPEGRPSHYPVPDREGLLFYIQRNQNINTVVYELNQSAEGLINLNSPMHVYWIKYNENMKEVELNFIQNKLAYGYTFEVINAFLVEFKFVSYEKRFFIERMNEKFRVITKINGQNSILSNIYVYAEEFAVFPDVKFVEFYGTDLDTGKDVFEKIII